MLQFAHHLVLEGWRMMEGVIPSSEEVAFEPKPEEKEELGVGRVSQGKGAILTEGTAKILRQVQRSWGRCKDPEAGTSLICSGNVEASVAGGMRESMVGDGSGKKGGARLSRGLAGRVGFGV